MYKFCKKNLSSTASESDYEYSDECWMEESEESQQRNKRELFDFLTDFFSKLRVHLYENIKQEVSVIFNENKDDIKEEITATKSPLKNLKEKNSSKGKIN